ncbi:MAG: hypothetical protein Q9162_001713 [Coniocarpon cinnabarinum]
MGIKSCKYRKRLRQLAVGAQRLDEPNSRWLARSYTRTVKATTSTKYAQHSSRLLQLPFEILQLIMSHVFSTNARAEYVQHFKGFPKSISPVASTVSGILELDSESESSLYRTLRTVIVSRETAALLGTCRLVRKAGLEQMYRDSTLAIQPRALRRPEFFMPRTASRYVTKLHLLMNLPPSFQTVDIFGERNASVRAFPFLELAVDSLDRLPNLKNATLELDSRFMWGLSWSCHEDKRELLDGPEARPLCQLSCLPGKDVSLDDGTEGYAIPSRLPRRYNNSCFLLNQAKQSLTMNVTYQHGRNQHIQRSQAKLQNLD